MHVVKTSAALHKASTAALPQFVRYILNHVKTKRAQSASTSQTNFARASAPSGRRLVINDRHLTPPHAPDVFVSDQIGHKVGDVDTAGRSGFKNRALRR